jgi:hypothetical protein
MAGRDLVDHSKSSWESLLPVAGVAAFVLVQRAKLNPIPKVALAGVCAGFTYGSLEKNTPKLGGALGGIMAAYAVLKGLEEVGPGSHATGLSWADLEQATPDLHAAKRAAQIALHGATSMPGIMQMGWHLERALDPMTKEDVP